MVESIKILDVESENHNNDICSSKNQNIIQIDPFTMFLHAMKSPVTKKKYSRRLEMFFDFTQIPGRSLEERCQIFVNK